MKLSRLAKIYFSIIGFLLLSSILGWKWLEPFQIIAELACAVLTIYYAFRILRRLFRKFLWRIRRKLVLSYIFIGFVPIFLVVLLFLLGSYIFLGQTTSEILNSSLDAFVLQVKNQTEHLSHLTEFLGNENGLHRWLTELTVEDRAWLQDADIWLTTDDHTVVLQGDGSYDLPQWAQGHEFSGLIIRNGNPYIAAVHLDTSKNRSMQFLVPVNSRLLELMSNKIDADIRYLRLAREGAKDELNQTIRSSGRQPLWPKWWDFPIWWLSMPDQYDWESGQKLHVLEDDAEKKVNKDRFQTNDHGATLLVEAEKTNNPRSSVGAFVVTTHFTRVYQHIFSRSTTLQKFVYALMVSVAIFFLFIELLSVIFGFLLARSITASVHNLFDGTLRIKAGDLNYKIKVASRDQLGDLAISFNSMTESIRDLMVERTEKERLSESLRIARQMQQNLLPREVSSLGQLEISAMNIPAQEVCGDYYDIIRNGENEVGIIVADVSGKGPSAALYMAEVKGVVLSVSQSTVMPRELLLKANSILGPTLDAKNFITMTYAMLDAQKRTMRLSRAGHNPVLHYRYAEDKIDIIQPGGIGLGLARNGMFEKTLEEVECKLHSGDVLVFYTDGLTEAMNEQNQLYGLPRLHQILLQNRQLSAEEIKIAIMRDLQFFLQNNAPQDDVTLVLLKVR
jgi:serine phosphatase RsbU (regulator of sigma subunit)/predicted PurR-regulated permease PerM